MTPAIFAPSGPRLTADERAFFSQCKPAGYNLFGRNCENAAQLRALTDSLRDLHGRDDVFIAVDQEGGRVARMRPPEWSDFPAGEVFDLLYQKAPATAIEAARVNARAMGLELREMGFTADFHPPLDLRGAGTHDAIGDRSLGGDPLQVAALGRAILDGLASAGIVGCVKHMPGQGKAEVDSHKELPRITAKEAELEDDIAPFRALNNARVGMTGHVLFSVWDEEDPATTSKKIIEEIIRGKIGFDGLLLTDDIDMQALRGSIMERAVASLKAGCDIVLNCWGKMEDMEQIVENIPPITDAASRRLSAAYIVDDAEHIAEEKRELLAKRDALLEHGKALA